MRAEKMFLPAERWWSLPYNGLVLALFLPPRPAGMEQGAVFYLALAFLLWSAGFLSRALRDLRRSSGEIISLFIIPALVILQLRFSPFIAAVLTLEMLVFLVVMRQGDNKQWVPLVLLPPVAVFWHLGLCRLYLVLEQLQLLLVVPHLAPGFYLVSVGFLLAAWRFLELRWSGDD